MTILCFGDSNTWGYDAGAGLATPVLASCRMEPEHRWTGVLAREIGAGHRVIEEGLCGRTTVFDDPVEGLHRNGSRSFLAILESHAPVDVVVLALGINDCKARFSASAEDIAQGIGSLARTAIQSECGPGGSPPRVLLVAPTPLGEGIAASRFYGYFGADGRAKSLRLASCYADVARALGADVLDAGTVAGTDPRDSTHYDRAGHEAMGKAIAKKLGLAR